ncbi:MAG TPA: hypothetical protein VL691_15810 [Vicinamibacteria bacterium]|nr:hypothetical protein [Vicinamibacteria bacterium]
MILTFDAPKRRWVGRVRFASLALIGLIVGHDAVYLGQGGSPVGLIATHGHEYWLRFALLGLVLGGIPIVAAAVSLVRLWGAVRADARLAVGDELPAHTSEPSYTSELLPLFVRLFVVIALAFAVQENLEHLATGSGFIGLGALSGPGYPLAVPILAGVALLLAAAGAWFRTRAAALRGQLAAIRRAATYRFAGHRRAPLAWRQIAAQVAHRWLLARARTGRAPPRGATIVRA